MSTRVKKMVPVLTLALAVGLVVGPAAGVAEANQPATCAQQMVYAGVD